MSHRGRVLGLLGRSLLSSSGRAGCADGCHATALGRALSSSATGSLISRPLPHQPQRGPHHQVALPSGAPPGVRSFASDVDALDGIYYPASAARVGEVAPDFTVGGEGPAGALGVHAALRLLAKRHHATA